MGQSLTLGTASDGSWWLAASIGFYGVAAIPARHWVSPVFVRKATTGRLLTVILVGGALDTDVTDAATKALWPVSLPRGEDSMNWLIIDWLVSANLAFHALHIIDHRGLYNYYP